MPVLVALLANAFRIMLFSQAGRIIVGILSFFGLQWATHKFAIGPAVAWFQSQMGSGPVGEFGATALAWMGVLRFDQAISMLLSAWGVRVAIDGAKGFLSKVV